jgi:hypothetical protein
VGHVTPDNSLHNSPESEMSEIMYTPWSCQNCFQSYSTQSDLRKHVEAYKVCSATSLSQKIYYLKMAQNALQHSAHFFPRTSFPESEDLFLDPGQTIENDAKLSCPHPMCQDVEMVFTKKRNLLRHFARRTTLLSRDWPRIRAD